MESMIHLRTRSRRRAVAGGAWAAWMLGWVCWPTGTAAVEGWIDVLESAQDAIDGAIQEATDGEYGLGYRLVPPEEFRAMLSGFHALLRGEDLDALADWTPTGEAALEAMEAVPALEPYADWLRQRLDFAEMARDTRMATAAPSRSTAPIQNRPAAPPPRTLGQPPPTRGKPPPTHGNPPSTLGKPSATPVAPSVSDRVMTAAPASAGASISGTDTWRRKLSGRPAPARAEQLAPGLKRIFQSQGIPPELIWIAEVESTFNPQAQSPVGAAGLFQLMPATARHLGLSTDPNDQRYDPELNARAAAKYLDYLHGRFNDWPLAIAAYNGGEGRVSRLLKQQQARRFEDIAGRLPTETRMYVPKVLATIELREGQVLR